MTSVVIVPPPNQRGIYEDNRIWARQYVAANPSDRFLIELSDNTPQAVLDATRAAVARAGRDGEIIYAVGHGGATEGSTVAGSADFAPHRAFRVSQFLAFYNDQTNHWNGPSIVDLERQMREIQSVRSRPARRRAEQAWCGANLVQVTSGPGVSTGEARQQNAEHCETARRELLALQNLQPHYLALGQIFQQTPVRRIVLLTCNVGNATDFLNELSTDLNVPVTAYTERVISRWERRNGQTHVWMFLEGDQPGQGSNNDRADREMMPGVSPSKVRTGRVLSRPAATVRRRPGASVPPVIER